MSQGTKIESGRSGRQQDSTSSIMTTVETFKSSVTKIRDILRTQAVTGMDSMRHMSLYLLSRYMTKEKAVKLGVPLKFSWESMIEMMQKDDNGVQKSLEYFFNKHEDCLVNHFDRLFGTDNFSFDVKSANKHKEIMEILDRMKPEHFQMIDSEMDILGWVYEQHLKTGASAARDLGQFFTDRSLCEYMTQLCRPGFKRPGVPESVCDPSMGTGGFLTSFMKYYNDLNNFSHPNTPEEPVDWSVQIKEIHGYDNDAKVAGLARLNLFMESGGFRPENLKTRDTLHNGLELTGYDIILANMPFGLKGLKYADCCPAVKGLKIQGTKSEPLFLQLMMASLNPGGRCAVVVPDGMLVNTSKCHDETRKYLLDHFDLRRVIKMKGKFFMNTGIQPSILFFHNSGKPSRGVEFSELEKTEQGEIKETTVLYVKREKLDSSYSFDMRRYMEVEKPVANPAGFHMVKLGDLFNVKGGKAISKKDLTGTLYPYYGCNGINGHVDEFMYDGEHIICAQDGSIGSVYLVNEKFYPSNHTHILQTKDESRISNAYGAYFLKMKVDWKILTTSVIPKVTQANLLEIKILVPPLPIQQEIVATLDRIYAPGTVELADTLKMTDKAMDLVLANPGGATLEPIVEAQRLIRKSAQMVADVKAQMVAVVKASMSGSGCKKYTLSDIATDNPESLTKTDKFESINYIDLGSVKEGNILEIQTIPYTEKPSRAQRKVKNGDIIWGGVRPLSKSYAFVESATSNTIVSSGFVVVRNKDTVKVLSKYLYYLLTTDDCVNYLNNHSTGTSYPAFNASTLMSYELSIPSIEVQTATLSYLNDLQTQLTSLENLQKQSERNAKFILDSYLNKAN